MAKESRKPYAPGTHEPQILAEHISYLLANPNHQKQIEGVKVILKKAAYILNKIEPITFDLNNLDSAIPYALYFERKEHSEKIRAAGNLLRMCLHIIDKGRLTDLDKSFLPMKLASLTGYDQSTKNAEIPRKSRKSLLETKAVETKKNHPGETYKEILNRLEYDNIVTHWDASEIHWLDLDNNERITKTTTFQDYLNSNRS